MERSKKSERACFKSLAGMLERLGWRVSKLMTVKGVSDFIVAPPGLDLSWLNTAEQYAQYDGPGIKCELKSSTSEKQPNFEGAKCTDDGMKFRKSFMSTDADMIIFVRAQIESLEEETVISSSMKVWCASLKPIKPEHTTLLNRDSFYTEQVFDSAGIAASTEEDLKNLKAALSLCFRENQHTWNWDFKPPTHEPPKKKRRTR